MAVVYKTYNIIRVYYNQSEKKMKITKNFVGKNKCVYTYLHRFENNFICINIMRKSQEYKIASFSNMYFQQFYCEKNMFDGNLVIYKCDFQ
jgi:hypothetical protein